MSYFRVIKMLKYMGKQAVCAKFFLPLTHKQENLVLAKKTANPSVQLSLPLGVINKFLILFLTLRCVKETPLPCLLFMNATSHQRTFNSLILGH